MAGGLHFDSLADLPPNIQKQVAGKLLRQAKKETPVAEPEQTKRNKYGNLKTEINEIHFDSKKEARRFMQLQYAKERGYISNLRLQQDFTLQEAYTTETGERIRAIRYKADFTYKLCRASYEPVAGILQDDVEYWRNEINLRGRDCYIIEDTKSSATRTPQYRMKYKMMAERGFSIREV